MEHPGRWIGLLIDRRSEKRIDHAALFRTYRDCQYKEGKELKQGSDFHREWFAVAIVVVGVEMVVRL